VHVYSSADEAELFVNGVTQGRRKKDGYRFVWADVRYKPGTVEVVTYKKGKVWAREKVKTAGPAYKLAASVDFAGKELTYIAVDILDRSGTLVPDASDVLSFSVTGPAVLVGTDAGDPTSHVPFYSPDIPAFHGKASAIVKRTGSGPVTVTVKGKGFRNAVITL
jgi:beta-galactosidase